MCLHVVDGKFLEARWQNVQEDKPPDQSKGAKAYQSLAVHNPAENINVP